MTAARPLARLLAIGALMCAPLALSAQGWVPQQSGTAASLRGVSAVSAQVAWASGSGGTILRTTDGGATWQRTAGPAGDSLDFRSIHAFDSLTAVVASAGTPARIYRTENGGRSWTLVHGDPRPGAFFDSMAFWDGRHGLILSDPIDGHWLVLLTDDGGKSWHPAPAEGIPPALPKEGAFAASNSCIATADTSAAWFATGGAGRSRVFRTTDRGLHWAVSDVPVNASNASSGIFSIAFTSPQNGLAVGGDYRQPHQGTDNVAVTRDGGTTWTAAGPFRPTGLANAAVAVPATSGSLVAVGESGSSISLDGGLTWTPFDSTGFQASSFAGPTAGWAVGAAGRIARFSGTVPGIAPSTHPRGGDAHE